MAKHSIHQIEKTKKKKEIKKKSIFVSRLVSSVIISRCTLLQSIYFLFNLSILKTVERETYSRFG